MSLLNDTLEYLLSTTFTSSSMTNLEIYLIKNKTKQFRHKNICNKIGKFINKIQDSDYFWLSLITSEEGS